ncbi:hypothetical protein OHB07_14075 [Streptomyces sp. NBC_00111]|uniref:hypothetical protein n=1 Tax=Streptomyces sp. NBC_00111 TaxID=2975655 RepID=UPI003256699F
MDAIQTPTAYPVLSMLPAEGGDARGGGGVSRLGMILGGVTELSCAFTVERLAATHDRSSPGRSTPHTHGPLAASAPGAPTR